MEQLKNELRDLKNSLFNLQSERSAEDIHKILEVKGLSDEATETMVLLHSNIKADIQAIKLFQIKTLVMVVDKLEAITNEASNRLRNLRIETDKEINSLKNRLDKQGRELDELKTRGLFNNKMFKILFPIFLTMLFLVMLHNFNPDATQWAGDWIKSMFGSSVSDAAAATNATPSQ